MEPEAYNKATDDLAKTIEENKKGGRVALISLGVAALVLLVVYLLIQSAPPMEVKVSAVKLSVQGEGTWLMVGYTLKDWEAFEGKRVNDRSQPNLEASLALKKKGGGEVALVEYVGCEFCTHCYTPKKKCPRCTAPEKDVFNDDEMHETVGGALCLKADDLDEGEYIVTVIADDLESSLSATREVALTIPLPKELLPKPKPKPKPLPPPPAGSDPYEVKPFEAPSGR